MAILTNPYSFGAAAPPASFTNTYSIDFDGVDDYVQNDSDTYDTGSWSMWVKYSDATAILFNAGATYYLYQTSGVLKFSNPNKAGTTDWSTDPSDDSWHHLVMTIDRPGAIGTTSTIKVYLDGALETTGTGSRDFTLSSNVLYFGRYSSSVLYYAGNIDEIGWWAAHTLTADEVTALYNSGVPTDLQTDAGDYASSANLTSYWRNGDPDGTSEYPTITDVQGTNDGTMTNMGSGDIVEDVP